MKNRKLRLSRRAGRLALASAALLAVAAGVAYATIPDAAGVINGCYRTSLGDQKGQLRIVDDPASCRSNETAIHWNQEGPQGEQGLQGPKGDKGDTGDTGDAGTNGTNGIDGTNGVDGTDGTNGVDGTNGGDGVDGDDGVSVTSAPESAGANCANGGSRFTAANGVTYACNGADGSGSAGPVLVSRSGVEQLGDFSSGVLASTSAGNLIWTCTLNTGDIVGVVVGFGPTSELARYASEGRLTQISFSGRQAGETLSIIVARSDESPNPRPFAITIVMTNGLTVAVRGLVQTVPTAANKCLMAYHVTVS